MVETVFDCFPGELERDGFPFSLLLVIDHGLVQSRVDTWANGAMWTILERSYSRYKIGNYRVPFSCSVSASI